MSAEMIQRFPESVKLICEVGTGYNNIDLEAAGQRGITVCNIPDVYKRQHIGTLLLNAFS